MANEENDDFLTHFSQSLSWICCNQSQSSPIPLTLSLLTPLPLKHDCKLECRGRHTDGRLLTLRAAARLTRKDQHRNPFFPIPSPRPFSAFVVCPGAARRPDFKQRREGVAGDTARGLRGCGGGVEDEGVREETEREGERRRSSNQCFEMRERHMKNGDFFGYLRYASYSSKFWF